MIESTVVNIHGVILKAPVIGPGIAEYLTVVADKMAARLPGIIRAANDAAIFGTGSLYYELADTSSLQ